MYGVTTKFVQSNYKSLLPLLEEKPTQLESNPQLTSTRESPRLTTKIRQSEKTKQKTVFICYRKFRLIWASCVLSVWQPYLHSLKVSLPRSIFINSKWGKWHIYSKET